MASWINKAWYHLHSIVSLCSICINMILSLTSLHCAGHGEGEYTLTSQRQQSHHWMPVELNNANASDMPGQDCVPSLKQRIS